MENLFTLSELSDGLIIEEPSSSGRKPLDLNKIKILKDAVFTKYDIPCEKQYEVWNRIKEIGNRKCRECRDSKKNKKKERCWLIKSKYYYLI